MSEASAVRDYAPFYCEENVLRLLSRPEYARPDVYALFVFGRSGNVAVYSQNRGETADGGLALWDYHVVALDLAGPLVLDFDSALGFSVDAAAYLQASFRTKDTRFSPLFRPVPARELLSRFDSDRSHMRDGRGRWLAPPPPWPRPRASAPGSALPLRGLLDPAATFDGLPRGGVPFDLDALRSFFGIR